MNKREQNNELTFKWVGNSKEVDKQVCIKSVQFSSVAQSCPTLCDRGLQHARLP